MPLTKTILLLPVSLLLLQCTQSFDAGQEEADLRQAITNFNEAFKAGNLTTLDAMVVDNYVHTNGTSKSFGKGAWFNYLESRSQDINDGTLEVRHYEMLDAEIEFFTSDAAILTARILAASRRDSVTTENEYRVTNLWVKDAGAWKRAAFHDGKIR